jgi:predicted acylesterase/phospholipase RssA
MDCSPDITIACNLHSKLPDKLSATQNRAIVKAQEKSSRNDEDLPSWFIDRALGVFRTEKLAAQVKSIRETFLSPGRTPAGSIRDHELFIALQQQLNQSRDKIASLIGRSFAEKDTAGMLNIFEVMLSATNIQQYQKNRLMLMHLKPDILIEPVVDGVRALEFNKGERTIEQGRIKALEAVPKIRALLERREKELEGGR